VGENDVDKNAEIISVVQSVLGCEASFDTSMDSAPNWDSLKTLQIVMGLDEAGISVPFERIAEIRSVADIIRMAG
jgi:acyl carrier protein